MQSHCLQEVVVSGSSEDECMHLWDLGTATTLVSYRPAAPASPAAVTHVGRDFLAVSQAAKASLHVFQWRRDQPHMRMSLPERLVAIAATADGVHIAGGAESGRIYLWEASTGAMLRSWEGHYRALTHMAFTDDGSQLVSCSEDSLVRVWSCGQLLDYTAMSSLPPTPSCSWSYHTLPITGLALGAGGIASYICTVSSDRSLVVAQMSCASSAATSRQHDVSSATRSLDALNPAPASRHGAGANGGSLATVSFPSALTALALHPADANVFVGASDGVIYCVDLCSPLTTASASTSFAVPLRLRGHEGAISSMCMSIEGCFLVSGSRDCTAKVWDCVSGQCLKSFTSHTGPVTYVATMFRPPQMLDGAHIKCATPLAVLARRQEMTESAAPGYAGADRRLPILSQGISTGPTDGYCPANGSYPDNANARLVSGLVPHAHSLQDVDADDAASAREEAERWKGLAGAMHQFLLDSVLVPRPN